MTNYSSRTSIVFRTLFLVLLMSLFPACGQIDWFPAYVRQPTTPDQFSFPSKTGVPVNSTVTSDPVTVKGLTADSSPISISGANNSQYSVNGGAATSAQGTVKNGDTVTVSHTSAAGAGQSVASTLTIGNVSATFTSVTQLVSQPTFTPVQTVDGYKTAVATISSVDTGAAHVVSVTDKNTSGNATGNAQLAITNPGGSPIFTIFTQTPTFLNGQQIWVRNLASNVQAGVITILTIDGVEYQVPL